MPDPGAEGFAAAAAVNSALTVWLEAAAAVLRNWKRQLLPIRRWLKTWKQLTPGGNRWRCRQPLQSSAVGKSAAGDVAAVAAAGDGHLESFVWHTAAAAAVVVVVVAAAVAAAASVACKFVVGLTLVGVEGVETVVCLMAWSYTAVAAEQQLVGCLSA